MATEYANGNQAQAALAQALIERGLDPADRLVGQDAVVAEALANLLNGEIPAGAELAAPGAGISAGVGTILETSVVRQGGIIRTDILIDLTGLAAAAAGDVIGAAAGGAAYIAQITQAVNGTIVGSKLECLEAPAGGEADIDLYSATAGTGAYNDAISGVTGQAQVINSGTLALGTNAYGAADGIAADEYLYLVSVGAGAATYTGGRLLITLFGV